MTLDGESSTMIAVVNNPVVLSDVRDQITSGAKVEEKLKSATGLYPVHSNESSSGSSGKSGAESRHIHDSMKDIKPNNPASNPVCKNCYTSTTPLWRRDEHGSVLCNACGLFLKLHGRPRPISLKTDVIKSRNRKSSHHDSPNEKKRKDPTSITPNGSAKKKKTTPTGNSTGLQNDQSTQHQQAVNSQQFPPPLTPRVSWQNEGQNPGASDETKFHKILPKSSQSKGSPLPHLSNILSASNTVPLTGDYPTPNSPRMAQLQRPPPHLATINEILSNTRAQHISHDPPTAGFSPPVVGNPSDNQNINQGQQRPSNHFPSISNNSQQSLQSANSNPLPSTAPVVATSATSVVTAPLMSQQHSQMQLSQPLLLQQEAKSSHISASTPPLELQNAVARSTSSSSSNLHPNLLQPPQQQHQQQHQQQQQQHQQQQSHSIALNERSLSMGNAVSSNVVMNNVAAPASPIINDVPKPSVSMILQSQEEVIKLKTRISELELVTDLYKRHVLELDSRCKFLEQELLSINKHPQNQ
ncbi:unnamed protein product [Kluyveromyces dobzhanskii CBS 2104]|uniref:WGS project CCBQ000000000 data, contig 00058 n=1 Tax=Kluyveromyces dobzhanskii CBS 2104 TaxID=1427455 RepID=A0A0A8LDB1_9SACH|nr:unnamed protein product [Kluyveromyces dobzhanskii CBS 2104]